MESIETMWPNAAASVGLLLRLRPIRSAVADSQTESGPWKAWSSPSVKDDPARSRLKWTEPWGTCLRHWPSLTTSSRNSQRHLWTCRSTRATSPMWTNVSEKPTTSSPKLCRSNRRRGCSRISDWTTMTIMPLIQWWKCEKRRCTTQSFYHSQRFGVMCCHSVCLLVCQLFCVIWTTRFSLISQVCIEHIENAACVSSHVEHVGFSCNVVFLHCGTRMKLLCKTFTQHQPRNVELNIPTSHVCLFWIETFWKWILFLSNFYIIL